MFVYVQKPWDTGQEQTESALRRSEQVLVFYIQMKRKSEFILSGGDLSFILVRPGPGVTDVRSHIASFLLIGSWAGC